MIASVVTGSVEVPQQVEDVAVLPKLFSPNSGKRLS
jgi:hypothetical protein